MSEFAGVDPHRVRLLANRLKDLADAIAKNGPIIRTNFSNWGGTLDLGQLAVQAAQVGQDAHDMTLRADEAANLLRQGSITMCTPSGDWVSIPWNTGDINPTQEAQQEAAELKKAVDNPNDPGSRQVITDIAQSMTDHQGDSAYMTAFMLSGGLGELAKTANALHAEDAHDGVVLSKDSQGLLAQFAQSTQIMSRLAVQGNYPHPAPDYLAQLTNPPTGDIWSAAMLFKYGPSGDKWDPTVLAAMTRTELDARQSGTLEVPTPDVQLIHVPDNSIASYEQKVELQSMLADFDPACAVLDRATQNGYAARLVLGGPNGERYAHDLLNNGWQTPGDSYQEPSGGLVDGGVAAIPGVDLSNHVAAFLQAATSAQFGNSDDAKLSAAALVNIVQVTGKLDPSKPDQVLPKSIREAFVKIADAHTADLSYSAAEGFADGQYLDNGVWLAQVQRDELDAFLRQATHDPQDAGRLKGCMDARISGAVGQQIQDGQKWLENMGRLSGMVQTAIGENHFSAEEAKSSALTENEMLMNILTTGLTAIPAPEAGVGAVATKIANPLMASGNYWAQPKLPQGDPAAALQQTDKDFIKDKQWVQVPVIQGLIDAGQIHPPADASWYQDGHVVANGDFGTWVQMHKSDSYSGQSLDTWINSAVQAIGAEQ
ncbi:hypothetical protein ABZ746_17165 [Streptomyces sp. NPDC020096]